MRTWNFPERKNQRRKKALENMLQAQKVRSRKNKPSAELDQAIEITNNRIVDSARDVRTKIDRAVEADRKKRKDEAKSK